MRFLNRGFLNQGNQIGRLLNNASSGSAPSTSEARGGFFFEDSSNTTTITTINTFVDINGTTTAYSGNSDFTHTNTPSALEYTGTASITADVYFDGSFGTDSGNEDMTIVLFKDTGGGYVANSSLRFSVRNNDDTREASCVGFIDLSNGDKVKIMIKNTTDTSNLVFTDFKVTLTKVIL